MMHILFNNYRIPVVCKKLDEGDFGQFYFFPYPEKIGRAHV